MKFLYFDTEYNGTTEKLLNVVCLSFLADNKVTNIWTDKGINVDKVKYYIEEHKDYIFVAFVVEAEARALLSLGIDPLQFKWIDLYLEYRHLLNHNHRYQYGKQLLNGKKVFTTAPINKFLSTEEQQKLDNNSKPSYSLSAACYKLLEVLIDTDRKDKMRDILIDGSEVDKYRDEILEYCESDVTYLPKLFKVINKSLNANGVRIKRSEYFNRAEYAVRTAIMMSVGYPVDTEAVESFSDSVADILFEVQEEINSLFPTIKPFRKNKDRTFSWNQKITKAWVYRQGHSNWLKTDKGSVSLSLEAFSRYYSFRHNYPKDNFGAQMVRYLKLKQQLNGFSPKSKHKFVDYLGSDGRVRPYFGIFGSQSGRSQPKATGFLFLKSAWMRALCQPKKGKIIGSIDYKSQEFILAAVESEDKAMVDAYLSGDPYLFFAKKAGAVPPSGTKKNYKKERDLFKATTLGLSYDMSKVGLAKKLTLDMGYKVTEDEAQELIDMFYGLYSDYKAWKKFNLIKYRTDGYLKLADGWYLWGDNENLRSVGNFPIQGLGAVVMRRAVALAQDNGLDVIMTLHDALYCEFNFGEHEEGMILLGKCMQQAFKEYLKKEFSYVDIGLDGNVWGKDLEDGYYTCDYLGAVKQQNIYIDERSIEEYENFKQYFKRQEFNL